MKTSLAKGLMIISLVVGTGLIGGCGKRVLLPKAVLAPKGLFAAGETKTTLSRDWSDVSAIYPKRAKKVSILSIDGLGLNLLFVSGGLTPNDPLMISPTTGDRKTAPAPRGKASMSLSEQIEFVSTSVATLDYQKVATLNPKPITISGNRGVRFELTAKTRNGLDMKGLAQAVTKGKQNYYVVYLAPAEHYYDASLKDAVAVMDGVVLP